MAAAAFLTRLRVDVLLSTRAGDGEFGVADRLGFRRPNGEIVWVPAGFVTDLVTRPWWLRWLVPQSGPAAWAAVLHDYLLSLSDPRAHQVFAEALSVLGVSRLQRRIMVLGVHAWSLRPWSSATLRLP